MYKTRSSPCHTLIPDISQLPSTSLLHIRWRESLHHTGTFAEASAENAVRVLEHAVFQTDDDELRALESGLDETADVLGM